MLEAVIRHRRHLHQIPELDNELPETLRYVESVLAPLSGTIEKPVKGAVTIFFDCGREETVAFRADMDALPVTEMTDVDFPSKHPGKMHACGHDGHTAMALRAAEEVDLALKNGESFPRNILFVFQPAEETTGGAKPILETGIFERLKVTRVFGLHLWPKLAKGELFSAPGPMMARSNEVWLRVKGKSVHLSRAPEGIDAMRAGLRWVTAAYDAVDALPPEDLRTMSFGVFKAGTVQNAIAGEAVAGGSLRTYSDAVAEKIMAKLNALAAAIQKETGAEMALTFGDGYPAVWNNEALFADVKAKTGEAIKTLPAPVLAAEDFSFYQRAVPGVFFFLGVGETAELHAPDFCWDDRAVLPVGVAFWLKLARLA